MRGAERHAVRVVGVVVVVRAARVDVVEIVVVVRLAGPPVGGADKYRQLKTRLFYVFIPGTVFLHYAGD